MHVKHNFKVENEKNVSPNIHIPRSNHSELRHNQYTQLEVYRCKPYHKLKKSRSQEAAPLTGGVTSHSTSSLAITLPSWDPAPYTPAQEVSVNNTVCFSDPGHRARKNSHSRELRVKNEGWHSGQEKVRLEHQGPGPRASHSHHEIASILAARKKLLQGTSRSPDHDPSSFSRSTHQRSSP